MRLAMILWILELERELLDNSRGTQTSPSSDKRSANIKIIVEIKSKYLCFTRKNI